VDLAEGKPRKLDTFRQSGLGGLTSLIWAPDSRWIAYDKTLPNGYSAIHVAGLEDGKVRQLTDGLSDAGHPVFDPSGQYLYFTASTDIGPSVSGFDMNSYPHRTTRSVYLAVQ